MNSNTGRSFFIVRTIFISIISFLIYHRCHAQNNPPQKINADYQFKGVGADSVMRPPKRMSSYNLDSGAIAYNGPDSSYYRWTGHQWLRVNGTATVPGNPLASVQFNSGGVFRGNASFKVDTVHKVLLADSLTWFYSNIANDPSVTRRIQIHTTQGDTATGTRPYGQFWHTLDQGFTNADGQIDAVYQWGYNQTGAGGNVNTNEASAHYAIESHFQPGGIGFGQMEMHLETKAKNGNVDRLFSYQTRSDNGGTIGFTTADTWDWFRTVSNGGQGSGPWMFADHTGKLDMNGSTARITATNSVSGSGFQIVPDDADPNVLLTCSGGFNVSVPMSFAIGTHQPFALRFDDRHIDNGILVEEHKADAIFRIVNADFEGDEGIELLIRNQTNHDSGFARIKLSSDLGPQSPSVIEMAANFTGTSYKFGLASSDTTLAVGFGPEGGFFESGIIAKFDQLTHNMSLGTSRPRPSAQLDMQSTSQGFAPPHMATSQKNSLASPVDGLQVYDLSLHKNSYWNGSSWVNSSGYHQIFIPLTGDNITLSGNAYNVINPATTLVSLICTLPSAPVDGDVVEIKLTKAVTTLTFSGGTYVSSPASAVIGSYFKLVFDSATSSWY